MHKQWELNWVDYYAVLEISRDASADEIKKSFRRLSKQYHPDLNHEEGATEKFQEISVAYETLSNEGEKKLYDSVWDARKNGTYTGAGTTTAENNVNYEDVKKHYTAEENRYAKRIALKKLIDEELKKSEIIINTKSEIIFGGYSGEFLKEEYYSRVKELVNIGFEYIGSLGEFAAEAYKYDLLAEVELINQTIEYLEEELKNMPMSPKDAEVYMNEVLYKQTTEVKIAESLVANENIISSLNDILVYVSEKQINFLEYKNILHSICLEAETNMSNLRELYKISNTLGLKTHNEEISKAMGKLDSTLAMMPDNYDDAVKLGKRQRIKDETVDVINSWNRYSVKIQKIEKLLKKNPRVGIYEMLYNYAVSILDEYLKELQFTNERLVGIRKDTNYDKLKQLSEDAIKLYDAAEEVHMEAEHAYTKVSCRSSRLCGFEDVATLAETAYSAIDKDKALEMLIEAGKLIWSSTYTGTDEMSELASQLYTRMSKIISLRRSFLSMYNMIDGTFYTELSEQNLNKLKELEQELLSTLVGSLITGGLGFTPLICYLLTADDLSLLTSCILSGLALPTLGLSRSYMRNINSIKKEIRNVKRKCKN